MIFGSVCSGIEAASVAWHPLGWRAAFLSEIEPFPRSVLAHHYPDVPLHGDFTTIGDQYEPIDLLVGGTPCQSFSVAGLRRGLDDDRGNLALEFLRLADRTRPRWVVWENVPGVLSSNGGRDFGAFLGGLGECGYGWAYRVLDAQYVRVDSHPRAVPQRRRRVFVVGYSGDWRRAAAVLFEREGMQGHPAPRREAGKGVAPTISARPSGGGGLGTDFDCDGGLVASTGPVSHCLNAGGMGRIDYESETLLAMAFNHQSGGDFRPMVSEECANALQRHQGQAVAIDLYNGQITDQVAATLGTDGGGTSTGPSVMTSAVRRLTPMECERLQGFPDGYTLVPHRGKPAADGPRYKALGNSMAVNVMRWIGQRIAMVEGGRGSV